jgi:diguanylate cyclase (GGDEF)-like protein/PAS domain S-box-containing protein
MPLAANETDASDRILSWNLAAEQLFGYSTEEALGREAVEFLVPERFRSKVFEFIERLNTGEAVNQNTNTNLTKDGREIVCEWRNAPLYDSRGEWIGWASLVKDITKEQAEAERLLYLSRHDPLTGLLNRRSVSEKLEDEGQRCARTGGRYATIMLDVDKFKDFNDRHGHECGDLVLKGIADAMAATVRATDSVSRWGGEEFLVLLPDTSAEGGFLLAEKIRKRIEEKEIAFGEGLFKVTVTAGIAISRVGDEGPSDCIRRADEALFAGKAQGRNRVVEAP